MIRRYTLDRASFEQFLAAASLLQQFQRQLSRSGSDAQSLWMLVDVQRSIESGKLDLEAALHRIPQLADQLIGGAGCGIWLFTDDDQFVWRGGALGYSGNERLRLEVLHRLASVEEGVPRHSNRNWDAGYYPGCVKSLVIEPIRQGSRIAGALACFSTEFDAFTDRESSKLRLLAGLLTQAVERATRMGMQQAAALEQSAMRQLVSRLVPKLQTLAENETAQSRRDDRYTANAPELYPEPETLPATRQEEVVGASSEEAQPLIEIPFVHHSEIDESPVSVQSAEAAAEFFQENDADFDVADDESSRVEEIYVPGLGVRSALYDDEPKQSSHFWINLRSGLGSAFAGFTSLFGRGFHAIGTAGSKSAHALSAAGSKTARAASVAGSAAKSRLQQAAQNRPKLPTFPADKIRDRFDHVRASCRDAASQAGSRVKSAAAQMPMPRVSKEEVQNKLSSAGAWTGKALVKVGRGLRDAPNVLPDLPALPTDKLTRRVNRAARSMHEAASHAANRAGESLHGISLPVVPRLNARTVRRGIPAVVVLSVMAAFLFSQLGHKTLETASASTRPKVSATPAVATLPTPNLSVAKKVAAPDLASAPTHRKVTDQEVQADLENMTRYEISTARRAAQYGDDVSAFQLGMAYETGYDVPQSCAKAAEWVIRAANSGNAAAQYNLGLRYRDGDGVSADPQLAASWLRKAADHKYPNAGRILASLVQ